MTQTSMHFAEKELAALRRKAIGSARRDAIAEYGGGDRFAEAMGVHETQLSQSLNDRADRPWREEWTTALLAAPQVSIATKRRIADALLVGAGLVAAPQEEVSVRQVAERALDALAQFGAHGAPIADELRGLLLTALAAGRWR